MNSECLLCFAYTFYYGHVPEQLQSIVRKSYYTDDFRRKLSLALLVPKSNYVRNSISYIRQLVRGTLALTNEHRASNNIASFKTSIRTDKFEI